MLLRNKIIARIKGGLGNQLFCYAAARRLALVNDADLALDNVTGFVRDRQYSRRYMLDRFRIPVRTATPAERLEPFERYRRGVLKWLSSRKPFVERSYLEQKGMDFDSRLLGLRINGTLYLDGLWQSEGYFSDVAGTIREDLRIIPPEDGLNRQVAGAILANPGAVALHVRWFDHEGNGGCHNVSADYYRRAIALMEEKIEAPAYFLFSDNPAAAREKLDLPWDRVTLVDHNKGDDNAWADLWLMTLCRHFIIANSTFSWWGAWLASEKNKIVTAPDLTLSGKSGWGFAGLLPPEWVKL